MPTVGLCAVGRPVPVPLLDMQPTKKVQPPTELPKPRLKWSKSKHAWGLPDRLRNARGVEQEQGCF